jgi:hypothetical protein
MLTKYKCQYASQVPGRALHYCELAAYNSQYITTIEEYTEEHNITYYRVPESKLFSLDLRKSHD